MVGQEKYLLLFTLFYLKIKIKTMKKKEKKLPLKWIIVGVMIFITNFVLYYYRSEILKLI